jgi:hypothetical protein
MPHCPSGNAPITRGSINAILAQHAVIENDLDRLLGEIVDQRQALQPPSAVERIHDEIHRPDLVWRLWQQLRADRRAAPATRSRRGCSLMFSGAGLPLPASDLRPNW